MRKLLSRCTSISFIILGRNASKSLYRWNYVTPANLALTWCLFLGTYPLYPEDCLWCMPALCYFCFSAVLSQFYEQIFCKRPISYFFRKSLRLEQIGVSKENLGFHIIEMMSMWVFSIRSAISYSIWTVFRLGKLFFSSSNRWIHPIAVFWDEMKVFFFDNWVKLAWIVTYSLFYFLVLLLPHAFKIVVMFPSLAWLYFVPRTNLPNYV